MVPGRNNNVMPSTCTGFTLLTSTLLVPIKNQGAVVLRLLLLLIFLGGGSLWMGYAHIQSLFAKPLAFSEGPYALDVLPGSSFSAVTRQFERDGLFPYPRLLAFYGRYFGYSRNLKAGEYAISSGSSMFDVLEVLKSGAVVYHQLTLLEGQTFKVFRQQLLDTRNLRHDITELSDEDIMEKLGAVRVHPEGQFYPDTYFFQKNDSDFDILQRAHRRLQDVLQEEWDNRVKEEQAGTLESLPYKTSYDALIMASIIEKETGQPKERPEIAAVFVQRLKKKMRLQTDPTVIYGLGERYQGNITKRHLREKTPYNTYRINGLPPTPIASVGQAAINAALHPATSTALYFVAKGDGSHKFSKTLKEHQKAVRKYQWKRKANYRSAPAPSLK